MQGHTFDLVFIFYLRQTSAIQGAIMCIHLSSTYREEENKVTQTMALI